ncbi:MAG: ribonuclease E/G, partial [Brachybacterium sp.]|nr:ribonuclease E/G [Brachybacterium sp.]
AEQAGATIVVDGRGLVVDAEGEHHHGGGGHDGEDSSKSSRRRGGRRSRGGAKDEGEGSDHGAGENGGDVHRLEGDETSRAQARATIASIAAASGSTSQADSQGEKAASTTWEQDAPEQG